MEYKQTNTFVHFLTLIYDTFKFLFVTSSLQDLNAAYEILYKDISVKSEATFFIKLVNKLYSLIKFSPIYKPDKPKYLLFSETVNGKNTLKNLVDGLRPESLALLDSCYIIRNSILLLPLGLVLYIKSILRSDKRHIIDLVVGWRNQIHASHKIIAATILIAYYDPKVIIVSNDHSPASRAMLRFGNFLGKETVYIPHSMITRRFPKLIASYNFLDGDVMWAQYGKTADVGCSVVLSGPVRMPSKYSTPNVRNTNNQNLVLGLCLNQLDDEKKVEKLISILLEIEELDKIIVRLHPNQHIASFSIPISKKVSLSVVDENIFEFIQRVDIILAGETAVHYDALLLNRKSFYYQFSSHYLDHYDFIKDGLVEIFQMEFLRNFKPTSTARVHLSQRFSPDTIVINAIKSSFKNIEVSNDRIYRF